MLLGIIDLVVRAKITTGDNNAKIIQSQLFKYGNHYSNLISFLIYEKNHDLWDEEF